MKGGSKPRTAMPGDRYAKLTVLCEAKRRIVDGRKFRCVKVQCDCGVIKVMLVSNVRRYKSCGTCPTKYFPGEKYGKLTIVREGKKRKEKRKRGHSERQVLVRCDCGNEKLIPTNQIRSTRSCGKGMCIRKYTPEISSAREVWRTRYMDGGLSFEEFHILSQLDCHYCRTPPAITTNRIKSRAKAGAKYSKFAIDGGSFTYNGLDRVDSNLPHHKDNIVPCCIKCNRAKMAMTIDEFAEHIMKVVKWARKYLKSSKKDPPAT